MTRRVYSSPLGPEQLAGMTWWYDVSCMVFLRIVECFGMTYSGVTRSWYDPHRKWSGYELC